MLLYCLKCRKHTESKNPKAIQTKNRRIIRRRTEEASGLLSSFGIKTLLSRTPIVGPIFL